MGGWWQEEAAESKLGQNLGSCAASLRLENASQAASRLHLTSGTPKPHLTRQPIRAVPDRAEVETTSPWLLAEISQYREDNPDYRACSHPRPRPGKGQEVTCYR